MPSTPEEKKKVLTRVRRIRGQIDALERSLEGDADVYKRQASRPCQK